MRYLPLFLLLCTACATPPSADDEVSAEVGDEIRTEFDEKWSRAFQPGQRREYQTLPNEFGKSLRVDGQQPSFRIESGNSFRAWGTAPMPFGNHPLGTWDVQRPPEIRP